MHRGALLTLLLGLSLVATSARAQDEVPELDDGRTGEPAPEAGDTADAAGSEAGEPDEAAPEAGAEAASEPAPQLVEVAGAEAPPLAAPPREAPSVADRDEDAGVPPPVSELEEVAEEPRMSAADAVGSSPRALSGERLGLWIETGLTADGTDRAEVIGWSTELGMRFRVVDGFVMDAHWGLTVGSTEVAGVEETSGGPVAFDASVLRVEPGNPVLEGAFERGLSDDLFLRVGLGVAIASAGRPELGNEADVLAERAGSEVTHRAAMAMRGWWSPWRWAPERFGLFLPARLVGRVDIAQLEGEAGLGVMFPVLGDRGVDPDVILQLAGGFGVEAAEPLRLGLRLRVVGGASGELLPDAVLSFEPWVRLLIEDAQIGLRGVLNATGADRLGSRRGPSWSILLSGGGAL